MAAEAGLLPTVVGMRPDIGLISLVLKQFKPSIAVSSAMLTEEEMRTLLFYRNRGRMFDVSISIIDEASSDEEEEAGNPQQAYQILRHSNSCIRVTLTPRNP